jgi:hypothetical protein
VFEHKEYIPIEGLVTPKVRVDLPLPSYIDQNQIGLHMGRVRTLCRMGGIAHLRITGHTDDETSSATPIMVGYDSLGGGYAGMLGTKVDIPTYRSSGSYMEQLLGVPHSARWVDGVVSANIDEITQRINQSEKDDIRSPEAWAKHLDEVVRKGIRDIGKKHLINGMSRNDYSHHVLNALGTYIVKSGLDIMDEISVKAPGKILLDHAAFSLIFLNFWWIFTNYLSYYPTKSNGREEGSRLSLIYGPQIDRALILHGISAKKGVVKPLTD